VKDRVFAAKGPRKIASVQSHSPSAGGKGLALAAPPNGIDFIDRAAPGDPAAVHAAAVRGTQGPGGPLPHLGEIQKSFGRHDVTGVRAHTGAAATQASTAMGAEAFAFGNEVAFAGTPGLRVAAHEAAHAVQQRAGVHLKGGVGQAGDEYERHADAVAERVARGESAEHLLDPVAVNSTPGAPAVQRSVGFEFELRENDWLIWDRAHRLEDRTAPEKGTAIIHGQDFQLQAEYSGAKAVAELVTNYPGLQTREQFVASVNDMVRLGRELDKVPADTVNKPASDFEGGDPEFVMDKMDSPAIKSASLQVTAGVPLASVAALYRNLEGIVSPGERGEYQQARERGGYVSGWFAS
jgi:hypothetical protein